MIKLIVSDFDGTLVPLGKDIVRGVCPRVKAMLVWFMKNKKVMIATGRHPSFINKIIPDLCFETIIGFSGNLIWHQGRTIIHNFENEEIRKFMNFCSHYQLDIFLCDEKNDFYFTDFQCWAFLKKLNSRKAKVHADIRELSKKTISEVLEQAEAAVFCRVCITVKEKWPNGLDDAFYQSFPDFILVKTGEYQREILRRGINKATQIAWIAEEIGIEEDEIAVIGDSDNDIEMLNRYHHSFFVGDPMSKVKKEATNQVRNIEEALQIILGERHGKSTVNEPR